MTMRKTITGLQILVAGSLFLTACSGQPGNASTPTAGAEAIYTQAAQTVEANLALTAQVMPTETATPTVAPTETTDPAVIAGLTATAQAAAAPVTPTVAANVTGTPAAGQTPAAGTTTPGATLPAGAVGVPTATQAAGAPVKTSPDKAELIDQSPKDGAKIQKNASFDMTLVMKNSGTSTWTTAYSLVFFAGDRMNSPADYLMPKEVKPGDTVTLRFTLTAPDSSGDKTIVWAMRNADGANFYPLYLKLTVTD